jgi:hypothetical protein
MATHKLRGKERDQVDLSAIGLAAYDIGSLTKPRQVEMVVLGEQAEALAGDDTPESSDKAVELMAAQVELMLDKSDGVADGIIAAWNDGNIGLDEVAGVLSFIREAVDGEHATGND